MFPTRRPSDPIWGVDTLKQPGKRGMVTPLPCPTPSPPNPIPNHIHRRKTALKTGPEMRGVGGGQTTFYGWGVTPCDPCQFFPAQ